MALDLCHRFAFVYKTYAYGHKGGTETTASNANKSRA